MSETTVIMPVEDTEATVATMAVFGVTTITDLTELAHPEDIRVPTPDRPKNLIKSNVDLDRDKPLLDNIEPGYSISDDYREYLVEKRLGKGGFADVFLVEDSKSYLGEKLVMKIPRRNESPDALLKKLRSHFKWWKYFSDTSPNNVVILRKVETVRIFDEPRIAILMEHMDGGNLRHYVEKEWGGHPGDDSQLRKLLKLFLQACEALSRLHSHPKKFVHGDIKLDNMLLKMDHSICKLSDFEIMTHADSVKSSGKINVQGTPQYIAPEIFADKRYSELSDIFALGVSLYQLLSGRMPYDYDFPRDPVELQSFRYPDKPGMPTRPSDLNPVIPEELDYIVFKCLQSDPWRRTGSVAEIINDISMLGIMSEGASVAPSNLARLLIKHLDGEDLEFLADTLESKGYCSGHGVAKDKRNSIIEEHCYTESPQRVLSENCNPRQLQVIGKFLGLEPEKHQGSDELVEKIVTTIGFFPKHENVPGLESLRQSLRRDVENLVRTSAREECSGILNGIYQEFEKGVFLLACFYGQICYGSGVGRYLSSVADGKPPGKLTFGQKVRALRELCADMPDAVLPERVRKTLRWPLISSDVFEKLNKVVEKRNKLVHRPEEYKNVGEMMNDGRAAVELMLGILDSLSGNPYRPVVVRIISRQEDEHGRFFCTGLDDLGRKEKIFSPHPMEIGALYSFFSFTNPTRVNPLIFPTKIF